MDRREFLKVAGTFGAGLAAVGIPGVIGYNNLMQKFEQLQDKNTYLKQKVNRVNRKLDDLEARFTEMEYGLEERLRALDASQINQVNMLADSVYEVRSVTNFKNSQGDQCPVAKPGSGFAVGDYTLFTARHVTTEAEVVPEQCMKIKPDRYEVMNPFSIEYTDSINEITGEGEVINYDFMGVDTEHDIAILRSDKPLKRFDAKLGNSDSILLKETVIAFSGRRDIPSKIDAGYITGLDPNLIEANFTTYTGFSGGPVIRFDDGTPKVVGVVMGFDNSRGRSYFIPINKYKELLPGYLK